MAEAKVKKDATIEPSRGDTEAPPKKVSKPRVAKATSVPSSSKPESPRARKTAVAAESTVAEKEQLEESREVELANNEGGDLTLEDVFEPQPEDTYAEDKAARIKKARELADEAYEKYSGGVIYSLNGTIVAPGYWQAWAGKGGRFNVFAWLGLLAAFVFFPLGLLFSSFGLLNAKAVPDDKFSRVLSGIGLGVSVFFTFFILFQFLLLLSFSVFWGSLAG